MEINKTRFHYHIVKYFIPLYDPNRDDIYGVIFNMTYNKKAYIVNITKRKYEVMIMDELNNIGTVEVKILKHEL